MPVFSRDNYSYLFFPYPESGGACSYNVSNALTSTASLSGEVTYSATQRGGLALPEWLSFDPVTHIFSGTPTGGDLGTLDIKVLATDGTSQLEVGVFASVVGDSYIKANDLELLHDVTLSYFKNDVDTGVSSAVSDGAFTIDTAVEFDTTKLSSVAYNDDINITDAIDILRHIVDLELITAGTANYHAADVDNDGKINISDAIDVLRHIVELESIDTFDLLDGDGNRITALDTTTTPAPSWTIIANGDVDQSGSFIDDFVSTVAMTWVNGIPTISVASLTNINENASQAVAASVTASDTEDGALSVSLSGNGADDSKFEIVNGNLRLKDAADYEAQSSYRIQLSVTDVYGDTVLKNIEVSVNNLAEDISGSVVDGYVAGATIFQDLDNDNVLDAGEPSTTTSSTGEFTLSNIVASSSAPLKIISGFDIATNKAIVTSLGTPSNSAAQVLVSPLSTVSSLANINDNSVGSATSIDRVATYFDVSSTSQSNLDILSVDPLDKLRDSDADIVSAAKDVFEANQLVMALTHSVEAVGAYLANAVDAAVHTQLDTQSITGYEALASGGIDEYKKIAADALMEGAASHIVPSQTLSSTNAFQISNTQVILRDFDPDTGLNIENRIPLDSTSSVLTLDTDNTLLNLQNLDNLGADSGEFTTPTLSFAFAKIPTGSGSSSFTFDLIEGDNSSRDNGEKHLHLNFNVNWTADGTTAQITTPPQTVSGYYYLPKGTRIDFEVDTHNSLVGSNIVSVTKSEDGSYPVVMNINLGGLVTHGSDFGVTSFAGAGAKYINLSTTLPIVDEAGATISSINSVLRIAEGSALTVFVADAEVHEGDATPTAVVYLNHAHSEDVTLSYTLSSIGTDSATADVDYSASTGTVTILAGYTSATIALPILTDASLESSETLTLTANSVTAGTLINSTASITIHDSTKTVTSSGELSSLSADVVDSINSKVTTALEDAYTTAATNAGKTWALDSTVFTTAANNLVPGLKTIVDVFYGIIKTEIDSAAATEDVSAFASSLMVANAATKLFDPTSIIGTNINGDGSYPSGESLTTLTAAITAEYTTFKSLTNDTIGDIFGDDTATYFASATVAMLTDGNDTETLSSASEIIATFDGVDTVYGGAGNDKMIGGKDVDTLYGGDGIDHIYGFTGDDVLDGGAGADKIVGGLGDDTITAGAGDDYVMAQTGDDTITTGSGSDEVYGGLGDDTITVDGTGSKVIDGGTGTDTLQINLSIDLEDFSLLNYDNGTSEGGTFTFTDSSNNTIAFDNIENLSVNGTSYQIIYSQGNSMNGILGDAGLRGVFYSSSSKKVVLFDNSATINLRISSLASYGLAPEDELEVIGSLGNDYIIASGWEPTTINAGVGNDEIRVDDGGLVDTVYAGSGDDLVFVDNEDLTADNVLDGGDGTDTLVFNFAGSAVTYTINANVPDNFENLVGTTGDDTLTGDANANDIRGGQGTDTIYGGAGNDILYGGITAYQATTGSNSGWSDESAYSEYPGYSGGQGGGLSKSIWYAHRGDGGNDKLYGGAGDDALYGASGDDTLDGGTGKDTMAGGSGNDTFILRAGDGSTTPSSADAIYDFEDGTDVIGMDDGLSFDDLTIAQGIDSNASHTIVQYTSTSEYLAIIQDTSVSNITALDFTSTSTDAQTLTGTSGNNTLIGGSGEDAITTGNGTDIVLSYAGDDTITIDGTGNKTIDGGTGTDTLQINLSIDLEDFSLLNYDNGTSEGGTFTFTDSSNNTIAFDNIENLSVNGTSYQIIYSQGNSMNGILGDAGLRGVFYSSSSKKVVLFDNSATINLRISSLASYGLAPEDELEVIGSLGNDYIIASGWEPTTINAGVGNDEIRVDDGGLVDTVYAGSGDDLVFVDNEDLTADNVLDGGDGTDTLVFNFAGSAVTYTINANVPDNFENLVGTTGDDTLTGDANANDIRGGQGTDTIYGGAGNDILYGGITAYQATTGSNSGWSDESAYSEYPGYSGGQGGGLSKSIWYAHRGDGGNDKLYGGAGDDALYGASGDDTLDGGTGKDTMAGGSGNDTFILRAGDGSTTPSSADAIYDFEDGTDVIGMDDGLLFADLSVAQGTGDYSNDTLVSITATGEYLAIVEGINATALTENDFTPVDIL